LPEKLIKVFSAHIVLCADGGAVVVFEKEHAIYLE
jgi:hypothetical protein